jgi:hypothetical protein
MNMVRYVGVISLAVPLAWHSIAMASLQVDEAAALVPATPTLPMSETAPAELEPITVKGSRSREAVQRELVAAQDQAYQMFNELNPDNSQDIICKTERPRGKTFPRRVCKARFHREAEARAALELTRKWKEGVSPYHLNRQEIDEQYEGQRELMAELANSHPEFRALLEKTYALRLEFEARGGTAPLGIGSQ